MTNQELITDSWLDALTILREHAFPGYSVGNLLSRVRFSVMQDPSHVAHVASLNSGRIAFRIHPKLLTLPRIERAEYFLSMALEAWRYLEEKKWDEFRDMCTRLGCDYSNSINSRERWRWIEMLRGADKFWYNTFEDDRPKCLSCDRPMPTGSDCHPVRKGVHENCGYELDALMEKVRLEEEARATSVIDLMRRLQKSLARSK